MESPSTSFHVDYFELPEDLQIKPDPDTPAKKLKSSRQERPTECSICGFEANGYHYEVPSCNGCKTFFRRTLLSSTKLICKAENDCFDLTKRAAPIKCRACRYTKCVEVGMNTEAMNLKEEDDGKLRKRSSEKENHDDRTNENVFHKQLVTIDNRKKRMIEALTYLELKIDKFRKCSYNPDWKNNGLEKLIMEENKLCMSDRVGIMPGWPVKVLANTYRANLPFNSKMFPRYDKLKKQWTYIDLLATVEYAKTFMFFHQLDHADRVILLKYSALACMNLLVSFYSVQNKFDECYLPDGSFGPKIKGVVTYDMSMSIEPFIRYNISLPEYALLKAICLCNPAVPDLSQHAQRILTKEREMYADSLFDHCIRDPRLGAGRFALLIGIMDILERQQRLQKDMHLLYIAPFVEELREDERITLFEDIIDN